MDYIINVTSGQGGNAFLIVGQEKTALVDCGMAYCAAKLISTLGQILQGRALDYLFISHSHYDHIGATPYVREKWPKVKVLGADYARKILTRKNALDTIRVLSSEAAKFYGAAGIGAYDDKLLKVDDSICDGDLVELGGVSVKVLSTTGHTQCSLSYLINNKILFASESTGYMSKSGKIYPAFITSAVESLESITLCQNLLPEFIISPHYGLVSQDDTPTYWKNCKLAIKDTQEFIVGAATKGCTEEQIVVEYESKFRDEQCRLEQPLAAFRLNTRHMIKTALREKFLVKFG